MVNAAIVLPVEGLNVPVPRNVTAIAMYVPLNASVNAFKFNVVAVTTCPPPVKSNVLNHELEVKVGILVPEVNERFGALVANSARSSNAIDVRESSKRKRSLS